MALVVSVESYKLSCVRLFLFIVYSEYVIDVLKYHVFFYTVMLI
ncbi:hypothetical protein EMUR_00355 [Ehrlichia muris AS145]|uniref:Uncharacterized protein n=1 Tax=Ehrlichia muris AS145 TaxID=1423892 RepID=V9R8N7_9RICK|nr:hypothetical protein EMUR_00355 [Ehrlichia muris AS145]